MKIDLKKFKLLSEDISACGGGRCPSIRMNANGDVIIQGKKLSNEVLMQMDIPADEEVIYLSWDVLKKLNIEIK